MTYSLAAFAVAFACSFALDRSSLAAKAKGVALFFGGVLVAWLFTQPH